MAILSLSGKTPDWKDLFTRRARRGETEDPWIFSNFMGILLGTTDLDGFRMLIKSLTSMEVTGVRKRELQVLLDRYSRGDLGVFGIVFVISSAIFTKKSLKIF